MRKTTNDFNANTNILPNRDVLLLNSPPPRRCEYCRKNFCIILSCSIGISIIIGLLTMLNVYAMYEEYGSLSV